MIRIFCLDDAFFNLTVQVYQFVLDQRNLLIKWTLNLMLGGKRVDEEF